ncbi:MAG: glycogen/starch synthase [Spirochaetales bacterium]|nr:glycogen/starch synthase [Spirochaetales bacterium]
MGGKGRTLNVWHVTREYAGIAEAGGVKNVACSLAEGLVRQGAKCTVFIPFYGCTMMKRLAKITELSSSIAGIICGNSIYRVAYGQAEVKGVRIIFVMHRIFTEKRSVYVYTAEDEKENPEFVRGSGHKDANIMNTVFQKAVIAFAQLSGEYPDIVQCQDAHTALIPAFAKASPQHAKAFANTRFFVTIHNAGEGYRQQFNSMLEAYSLTGLPMPMLQTGLMNGRIEPFLVASVYATLSTVSPWYADELRDVNDKFTGGLAQTFAEKNIVIKGITNGIDVDRYCPEDKSKSLLPYAFNPKKGSFRGKYSCRSWFIKNTGEKFNIPGLERYGGITHKPGNVYFAYHGRLVHQKGLEVLADAAEIVLKKNPNACFIVIGQGDSSLEECHKLLAEQNKGRYIYIRGYERSFVRLCVAVADFIVLPSFFEPCGLEDFIAQIFGTIPVAHAVGGLNKIIDGKTGFLYEPNTCDRLADVLLELIDKFQKSPSEFTAVAKNAATYVEQEYSWDRVIEQQYLPMYTCEDA